jgi:transposase
MIQRFHGLDRHKKHSTISVLNREGQEVEFLSKCPDLRGYIEELGPEDTVVMEAATGSFFWADLIESTGATCHILHPYKFKIIRDSWNKTDKHDARNMAKALWVYLVTGEFGIPTVYKPSVAVRELRRLFCQYNLLNRQVTALKNTIQAILADNGVSLTCRQKTMLSSETDAKEVLNAYDLSPASLLSIQINLEILWKVEEQKNNLKKEILLAGEPFAAEVKLLITVRGITPLAALAFLADVADIRRFKTLRKMNAYLGLVPRVKESGGRSRTGHINRESRRLTRTLFTQSVMHFAAASPYLRLCYSNLVSRRGVGRARIALIRKICGMMRRMLLEQEEFRWMQPSNFERKLKRYENQLKKIKKIKEEERKSA